MRITEHVYQVSGIIYGMNSNVYAIDTESGVILIDAGYADKQYGSMMDVMKQYRLESKVTAVFLTHAHLDHAGNAYRFEDKGAEIYIGHKDKDALSQGGPAVLEKQFGTRFHTCQHAAGVKDGDFFDFGDVTLKVIDIPGHTAGAVAYLAEADGKVILFIGDMFSLQGATPQDEIIIDPGWDGGPDFDAKKNVDSFELLKTLNPQIIAPGHSRIYIGDGQGVLKKAANTAKERYRD